MGGFCISVLIADENWNSKNIAIVLTIVTVCLKEREKVIQTDLDGSQDVPTEWKLIRRDIPEGV